MRALYGLFGRSPFEPLARHTERVHETVELIRPLFTAFLAGDWDEAQNVYERISKLEHKADVIKNELRDHLPKSLFMPIDRGDMLTFLKEQDAIADAAEDLGVILTMRRTGAPEALHDVVLQLVEQVIATSEAWYQTAKDLPMLQEAAFTGPDVERTMEAVQRVSDLEWEADKLQAAASRIVFEHEEEMGAVSVMVWTHILEELGEVANHAENTADLLRLMLARR